MKEHRAEMDWKHLGLKYPDISNPGGDALHPTQWSWAGSVDSGLNNSRQQLNAWAQLAHIEEGVEEDWPRARKRTRQECDRDIGQTKSEDWNSHQGKSSRKVRQGRAADFLPCGQRGVTGTFARACSVSLRQLMAVSFRSKGWEKDREEKLFLNNLFSPLFI